MSVFVLAAAALDEVDDEVCRCQGQDDEDDDVLHGKGAFVEGERCAAKSCLRTIWQRAVCWFMLSGMSLLDEICVGSMNGETLSMDGETIVCEVCHS